MVKWTLAHGCPFGDGMFECTMLSGSVEMLEWLTSNNYPMDNVSRSVGCATRCGHLEALKWAHHIGYLYSPDDLKNELYSLAGNVNCLEVLHWLRDKRLLWSENACEGAAASGHLRALKWARANGCPWNESVCTEAAKHNALKTLQWTVANGCAVNWSACAAVSSGTVREWVKSRRS